jgi:hypothetical protein
LTPAATYTPRAYAPPYAAASTTPPQAVPVYASQRAYGAATNTAAASPTHVADESYISVADEDDDDEGVHLKT